MRIVRRKLDGSPLVGRKRGTADASRRCALVEPKTRNRSEPEGWPPVELECRAPTKVCGSVPAQPEAATPTKVGGWPLGELEDAAPAVLRVIKIETPEASVSGVFKLFGILRDQRTVYPLH